MRPDILLITEMIDAAEQAGQLAVGVSATDLERDRQRRDALLWNEASGAKPGIEEGHEAARHQEPS
jgi:hypothetical protein